MTDSSKLTVFDFRFNIYFVLMFITALVGITQPQFWDVFGALMTWMFMFGLAKIIAQHQKFDAYEN